MYIPFFNINIYRLYRENSVINMGKSMTLGCLLWDTSLQLQRH